MAGALATRSGRAIAKAVAPRATAKAVSSPDGNVPTGGADSGGGFGSFDLGGRSLAGGGLSRPSYNAQVEGTIRIKIIVDPQGRVIHTSIAPGTTIDNYQMQRSALQAAERTRFNASRGETTKRATSPIGTSFGSLARK